MDCKVYFNGNLICKECKMKPVKKCFSPYARLITQNKNRQTDSDYNLPNRILKVCIDALLAVISETLTCCSSCGFV